MLFLARANKDVRLRECYNLFEKYNWDLTKFYNDTDLLIEEVRKNAREYAKRFLDSKLTKEQIWCLMPTSVRGLFNSYDKIIKQMLKEGVIETQQLTDIDWNIDNLKESLCRFCFDTCEKFKWVNIKIDEYCNNLDILPGSLKYLARKYGLEVLKWDKKTQEEHWNKKLSYRRDYNFDNINENKGVFANLFNKISQIDNNDEIIKVFSEFNREYFLIKHGLANFVTSYNIPNHMKEDLFNKLEVYGEYLSSNRKQHKNEQKIYEDSEFLKNNLTKAKMTVIEYINSGYSTVDEYCDNLELDKKTFDKYLMLIKDNDDKLYSSYIQHKEELKEKSYNELLSNSLTVINLLKNGIVENDVKREFDLVDYYRYLPLGFDRMLRIVRDGINPEDYKLLSTYVGKNKNDRELSEVEINNIYNMRTIVDVQFDEENRVIPGSGREITTQEKQNIVNYLKSNNIPVTNKTYNIIYKRWLSGGLVLEETKDKTK